MQAIQPDSLIDFVHSKSLEPLTGLSYPIESTLLFPVHKGSGKLILSFTTRENKTEDGKVEVKKEWALVGGKAESQIKGEPGWTDFSDKRFIKEQRQFTEEECGHISFENPRICLSREAVEEMTGQKGNLTPEAVTKFS